MEDAGIASNYDGGMSGFEGHFRLQDCRLPKFVFRYYSVSPWISQFASNCLSPVMYK